jgi:hypothetical protein
MTAHRQLTGFLIQGAFVGLEDETGDLRPRVTWFIGHQVDVIYLSPRGSQENRQ